MIHLYHLRWILSLRLEKAEQTSGAPRRGPTARVGPGGGRRPLASCGRDARWPSDILGDGL